MTLGPKEQQVRSLKEQRLHTTPRATAPAKPSPASGKQETTMQLDPATNPATDKPVATTPNKEKSAVRPAKSKTKSKAKSAKKASARKPAAKVKKATPAKKVPAKKVGEKTESKSDIVERLLRQSTGATRAQLSEATDWPHVNLKTAEKRSGMKLVEDGDRYRLIPAS